MSSKECHMTNISPIRSTTGYETPSSPCTRRHDEICTDGFSTSNWPERISGEEGGGAHGGGGGLREERRGGACEDLGLEPQCKMTVLPLNSGKPRDTASRGPTTIVAPESQIDPIAMLTSWRSNSDIASVTSIGYPRMSASGESSTTMHRLLHASGSHPIPTPYDPKLIHSKNGNHLESPNEGSSIDHQVTIYLHAHNITMFPTNETWYFASQILVSNSGGLILILTAQSTRNVFRMHSEY
ncbi:hypothetical protein F511_16961 [Dorcoceras hygrometricum]|uniref:Uncharacterized protein n=1 Tax=Dorcoceras hygrometricum TaxID=472368 RepID=A0A2Z7BNC9_9LAMI|nr:hypothetical protein F511_16961 [Dorcoceras hygrometricum]